MNKIKTFDELKNGDQIFLIDPSLPFKIRSTSVKEVKVNHPQKGVVEVTYFVVVDGDKLYESVEDIPTKKLLVRSGQTNTIAIVGKNPIPYFTDKKAMAKWMGKKKM